MANQERMSDAYAPTALTTTFHLPALKMWNALPAEPLRLIEWFALHEHKFQIISPTASATTMNTRAFVACVVIACEELRLPRSRLFNRLH